MITLYRIQYLVNFYILYSFCYAYITRHLCTLLSSIKVLVAKHLLFYLTRELVWLSALQLHRKPEVPGIGTLWGTKSGTLTYVHKSNDCETKNRKESRECSSIVVCLVVNRLPKGWRRRCSINLTNRSFQNGLKDQRTIKALGSAILRSWGYDIGLYDMIVLCLLLRRLTLNVFVVGFFSNRKSNDILMLGPRIKRILSFPSIDILAYTGSDNSILSSN